MNNQYRKNKLIYSRFFINALALLILGAAVQMGRHGFLPADSEWVFYAISVFSFGLSYTFYRRSDFIDSTRKDFELYQKYEKYTTGSYAVCVSGFIAFLIQSGSPIPNYKVLMFLGILTMIFYIFSVVFRVKAMKIIMNN